MGSESRDECEDEDDSKVSTTKHDDDDKEDVGKEDNNHEDGNIYQADGADSIGDSSNLLSGGSMVETVEEEDATVDTEEEDDDEQEDDDEEEDNDEEEDEDEHCDNDDNDIENLPNADDPPAWYEPYLRTQEARPAVLKRINLNNRVAKSSELPTIASTNLRSILPKFRNFVQDLKEREISLCFLSETWQKETSRGNKRFQNEVERMFELSGLKFISCPRPSSKRGGGAAIIVDTKNYTCEKLDILVPGNLECVWAILRPKKQFLRR